MANFFKKNKSVILNIFTAILFIFTFVFTFYSGYNYRELTLYEDFDSDLVYVASLLENNYVLSEYDKEYAEYESINAYLATIGDKYAYYSSPEEHEKQNMSSDGTNITLGISFDITNDNKMIIKSIVKGSNADGSGLKVDDVLVSIKGQKINNYLDYKNFIISNVFKENEEVEVSVLRDGKELSYNIVTKKQVIPVCECEIINDDIAYIRLYNFGKKSAADFKAALTQTVFNGKCSALIVDLRNNGGGSLTAMQDIAGNFVKNELISTFKYKTTSEQIFSTNTTNLVNVPVVFLVNENSASASECLTGALMCHNKITVIGTKTFGKGIGQTTYPCPSGGYVTFTTAMYYLPDNTSIHEKGITPDIEISLPEGITFDEVTRENDTQLTKAIEFLRKK